VRIREASAAGGLVEGRFLVVDADRITILRGDRSLVIPKASIDRIQRVRNDSIWNGAIIGAFAALLVQSTYGAEGCLSRPQPWCTLAVVGVWGGMGALFDYGIPSVKTVYRAPRPAMTLLRMRF
jgi:hypothetical protein